MCDKRSSVLNHFFTLKMHISVISVTFLVLSTFAMGATLPKNRHQPPLVQYHWTPQDLKLRDILSSYQRKVATCSKDDVGGLFYELSIFNLKPLVTPLRDSVGMILQQVLGLMSTNHWYPSFFEACNSVLMSTTTPCPQQKCPIVQCPSVDCPRQTCAACPPAVEKVVCPLLWPYITFGIFLGVLCCVLLLISWCLVGAIVKKCRQAATGATSASLDCSTQLVDIHHPLAPATLPSAAGSLNRAPHGNRASTRGPPIPPPPPPPVAEHSFNQEVILPVVYEEPAAVAAPPLAPVVEPQVVDYVARPTVENLLDEIRTVPRFQDLGRSSVIYDRPPLKQKRN